MPRPLLQKVAFAPDESFVCRRFAEPYFSSPWHFHPECELTWIVRSHGLRFVGDSIERFEAGDLVLLGSGVPHYWSNPPEWKGQAESIVLLFREDLLGAQWLEKPELAAVRGLLGRAARGLCFKGAMAEATAERMRRMVTLAPLPRLLLLVETLHELAGASNARLLSSEDFSPRFDGDDQGRLGRVLDYVNDRAAQGVQQPEAAKKAGLSPAAFSRYFRKKMGRTFEGFVNEVRIGRICRALVEEPDRTVAEIAFAAGYNNLANFNRQFQRRTGLTPLAYRRRG